MEELDKEHLTLLKNAFDAFDHEKQGVIGTDMIGTILEMLNADVGESELKEIINEVDTTGSGSINFEAFCSLAGRFLVEEEDDEAMMKELREAFRLYDREGNGYITTDVLKEIFKELDNTITAEDLDNMIQEIDADGSGTVDFEARVHPLLSICLLSDVPHSTVSSLSDLCPTNLLRNVIRPSGWWSASGSDTASWIPLKPSPSINGT